MAAVEELHVVAHVLQNMYRIRRVIVKLKYFVDMLGIPTHAVGLGISPRVARVSS